jgi:hypothetical protein
MQYHGNLYGKIGRKHFDTGVTTKDYDKMKKEHSEMLEMLEMHVDQLDLSNIEFYEKYGFNVSELMPKTRELIKSATEI